MRIRSNEVKRFLPGILTSIILITTVAILLLLSLETNRAPTARIRNISNVVEVGEPVLLDGTISTDPEGSDLSYHWTINESITTDEPVFLFSFPQRGNFTVVLRVEDEAGLYDVETKIIDVR